jgi:hypothetical protein
MHCRPRLSLSYLRPWPWLAGAIVAALAVSAAPARASLIMAVDLPELVNRSSYVAVVDVVSMKSAWDARHEQILTSVDLAVVETWKGTAPAGGHFRVVQPGGTVDDLSMVVHGMSHFQPGERALVFLRGQADHAAVVGMAQGKRLIRRDGTTGKWMVHAPDRAGAMFVKTTPAAAASPVFDTRLRTLDEVRTEIRNIVAAPPAAPATAPTGRTP